MTDEEKEVMHLMCGMGLVDGEPRVAVSISGDWTTYISASVARYFAMQILMTANEIDPKTEKEVE